MTSDEGVRRKLPRVAGIVCAAVALTSFFVYLRFPYDRLATAIRHRVDVAYGIQLDLGEVGPRPQLLGPGIVAQPVRITRPDGEVFDLDRLLLRPAWSLSWFSGRPAIHVILEGPSGSAEGTVTIGDTPGWSGELSEFDLERLPISDFAPGTALRGQGTAQAEIVIGASGLEGPLRFEASEGSIAHPQLPLDLPYEKLTGQLHLGGEQRARIESLELESPMFSASVTGTVGHGANFGAAPLNLEIELQASGAVQGALNAQGIEVGRDGKIVVHVLGTPERPIVR